MPLLCFISPLLLLPSPIDLSLFGSHGVADKHAVRRFPLICHQFLLLLFFFFLRRLCRR